MLTDQRQQPEELQPSQAKGRSYVREIWGGIIGLLVIALLAAGVTLLTNKSQPTAGTAFLQVPAYPTPAAQSAPETTVPVQAVSCPASPNPNDSQTSQMTALLYQLQAGCINSQAVQSPVDVSYDQGYIDTIGLGKIQVVRCAVTMGDDVGIDYLAGGQRHYVYGLMTQTADQSYRFSELPAAFNDDFHLDNLGFTGCSFNLP